MRALYFYAHMADNRAGRVIKIIRRKKNANI